LRIPGGQVLNKLSLSFNGDSILDLLIYDSKDGSTWVTPMTITTLAITVSDSYPNIIFENPHTVTTLTVSGTYCVCNFHKLKITTMTYDITVGSLSINQNSAIPSNKVIVTTPDGTHCAAGAAINANNGASCPTQSARDIGISGTYIDTTSTCVVDMWVCADSTSGSCPAAGTAVGAGQGSFTIVQDDGPIQFLVDQSTTTVSNTFNPTFDTFAITSQILLGENKVDFSTNVNDPRMYLYEVMSPGYKRMWAHSSLIQYIEARPWLLSLLSLSILQPNYLRSTLIHIPDSTCPLNSATNVKQNTFISAKLESLSYTESSHLIAQKANSTYYKFLKTAKGDYIQTEIPFLGGNIFIILCLVVSGLLAIYSVFAIFLILIRLKWKIESKLHKYLERNRRFAQAKKEIQYKNDDTKKKLVTSKTNKRLIKILHIGLLTTNLKTKVIDMNEEAEEEIMMKQNMKKRISLSFFQAPYLYLEHLRRLRANSFKMFLNSVYESPSYFPKWKLVSENFFNNVSVRLDLLEAKYLEYCTKEGLKPRSIEDEEQVIRDFNLRLEWKIDTSTDAYTNMRWKTPLEKLEEAEQRNSSGRGKDSKIVIGENENIISKFLVSECSKSSFSRDFILVSELKQRYDLFCMDNKIDDLVKINIVGCPELEQFGAKHDSNLYIPYLSGIVLHKIPGLKQSNYTPGIIRIPKESKARKRNIGMCRKIKNKIMYFLFSSEGVLTNFFIVVVHLLLLLLVPLGIFFAITWSLLQVDNIEEDVYKYSFGITDVFYASSYDFWINHLSGILLWYIMGGLCGLFFISGLIELISFYATGARDTGKYIVFKSWIKWVVTITFWILLISFIGMYSAYISVILVWSILGAVLNPQKFLPMAVGAIVIIAFSFLLYTRLKQINKSLEGMVGSTVDAELKNSLVETVKKELDKLSKLRHPPVEDNTRIQFNRALNNYMSKNNYPPVTQDSTDEILDGNMGELIKMMNKN